MLKNKPISIFDSVEIAKAILSLDLPPSKLDIGKLSSEWLREKNEFSSAADFLQNKLAGFEKENDEETKNERKIIFCLHPLLNFDPY